MRITVQELKVLIENFLHEQDEEAAEEEVLPGDEAMDEEEPEADDAGEGVADDEEPAEPEEEPEPEPERFYNFDIGLGDPEAGLRALYTMKGDNISAFVKNADGEESKITNDKDLIGILRHGFKKSTGDVRQQIRDAYASLTGKPVDTEEQKAQIDKELLRNTSVAHNEKNLLAQLGQTS